MRVDKPSARLAVARKTQMRMDVRMHRVFLLLLLATLPLVFSGCGLSEEDKDFYYKGWLKPTDLDREPPSRLGPHRPSTQMPRDPLVD
jgi:hypothetical protein